MKKSDKFDYEGECHTWKDCHFNTGTYQSTGNLYLGIDNDEEGSITDCSVNGYRICNKDEIGIKNWSENRGMDEFLIKMGIIKDEIITMESSGYVNILYYPLTESGKELFADLIDR